MVTAIVDPHKDKRFRKIHLSSRDGAPVARFGPERAGPAFADFCVEPQLLAFWKLKNSFVRTPPPHFVICPKCIARFVRQVMGSSSHSLSPSQRFVFLTVATLFLFPSRGPSESLELLIEEGRRCSSPRCACKLSGCLLDEAVGQPAMRRHSRSQAPELPGRMVFFTIATGRSPPVPASSPTACSAQMSA